MKYFRLGHIPEGGMSATFSQGTSGLLPPLLAEIFLFGESNQRKDPDIWWIRIQPVSEYGSNPNPETGQYFLLQNLWKNYNCNFFYKNRHVGLLFLNLCKRRSDSSNMKFLLSLSLCWGPILACLEPYTSSRFGSADPSPDPNSKHCVGGYWSNAVGCPQDGPWRVRRWRAWATSTVSSWPAA